MLRGGGGGGSQECRNSIIYHCILDLTKYSRLTLPVYSGIFMKITCVMQEDVSQLFKDFIPLKTNVGFEIEEWNFHISES